MTTTFTATNGITLALGPTTIGAEAGAIEVALSYPQGTLVSDDDFFNAMHEWTQLRRDAELGRWRDAETGLLVYRAGEIHDRYYRHRAVMVLDEELATIDLVHEGDIESRLLKKQEEVQAAARYFEQHPEPKPWHDAAENDIWLLDGADHIGTLKPYQVAIDTDGQASKGPRFFPAYRTEWTPGAYPNEFTTGRRIWPEQEAGDE